MEYGGLEITTAEDVYEPAEDSFLSAEIVMAELNKYSGMLKVIDIGCGSGILGLVAATNPNVGKVVFADINDRALDLCRANISRNAGIVRADCDVVKSDLFSDITESFDIIIFNAPYLPEGKDDKMASAWYGGEKGIEVSKKFLGQAVDHMSNGAEIILVESSLGDLNALREEINALGLSVTAENKAHIHFEDIVVMILAKTVSIGS
jgi:release factor glutamine methyltransferase